VENDLPDCLSRWRSRDPAEDTDRTSKAFFVPAAELKVAGYDLSLSRYKEKILAVETYDPPQLIIEQMKATKR